MKRRQFVSLVGAAAGAASLGTPELRAAARGAGQASAARGRARMVVGCQRNPTDAKMLQFYKRHAVDHICGYPANTDDRANYSADSLKRLKDDCAAQGVSLDMTQIPFMSSSFVDTAKRRAIMLGQEPDRQQEIDEVCELIKNCAAAGIPALKYNLSVLGVLRTGSTPGRGGTRYSTWKLADGMKDDGKLTKAGVLDADTSWERMTYFLERAVPVAEEYKVRLALHPHDPGVPAKGYRGVQRVLGTPEGLKKFVAIKESPYHGLNLCLGTTAEMLQDPNTEIHEVIRYFGERKKIFNIHFRNIHGKRDDFYETFPDEGSMDMVQVMHTLRAVDYEYMVMPDHMPHHPDDPDQSQAFAFGYGYIKALIQAVDRMS
jgi:mannonate dehydratase